MLPLPEIRYLLLQSASAETSVAPQLWRRENPAHGHCVVFALIVQDYLGGKIVRGFMGDVWTARLGSRSHYWNVLQDGRIVDLSRDQFPSEFPYEAFLHGALGAVEPDDKREYVLSNEDTKRRYGLLKERASALLGSNPLFRDEKFQRCWDLAFSESARCPKMRFACLVYDGDVRVAEDVNRLMTEQFGRERFCSLDGSRCLRMELPHRVDATIGDCGHAPVWCLRKVWDLGYSPRDLPRLGFYEGGFYPADCSPWWRSGVSYTCTYCENIFAIFGLDKIYAALDGKWRPLFTRSSFYSSGEYARGEKKT